MPDGSLRILGKIIRDLGDPHNISHVVVERGDIFLIGQLALGGQPDQVVDDGMVNAACLVDQILAWFDQAFILLVKGAVRRPECIHGGVG